MVQIILKFSQEFVMRKVNEIENLFSILLFFEHIYLIDYSKFMDEI